MKKIYGKLFSWFYKLNNEKIIYVIIIILFCVILYFLFKQFNEVDLIKTNTEMNKEILKEVFQEVVPTQAEVEEVKKEILRQLALEYIQKNYNMKEVDEKTLQAVIDKLFSEETKNLLEEDIKKNYLKMLKIVEEIRKSKK